MIFNSDRTKYNLEITSRFKTDYKKVRKQGKDINKLIDVLDILASGKNYPLSIKIINYLIIKYLEIAMNVI